MPYAVIAASIIIRVGYGGLVQDAVQVFVQAIQQERQQLVGVVLKVAFKLWTKLRNRALADGPRKPRAPTSTQRGRGRERERERESSVPSGLVRPCTSTARLNRATEDARTNKLDGAMAAGAPAWPRDHNRSKSWPNSIATRPFMPSGLL